MQIPLLHSRLTINVSVTHSNTSHGWDLIEPLSVRFSANNVILQDGLIMHATTLMTHGVRDKLEIFIQHWDTIVLILFPLLRSKISKC